ncbi:MAG: homoserine kinase [Verrucomicrobia bacterium A1]|nr:MAG: homoserine kinase [Verrucomicrobia bacterium A1]
MNWIQVFSPATIGNIGPGFDVLGMAVKGLGDTVYARRIRSGIRIAEVKSPTPIPSDPRKNTAAIAASNVFRFLSVRGGIELRIHKGLPAGSGLGSSAASAAAGAYAANWLYGRELSTEQLILAATQAEAEVSGGFFADNTAPALLGGATLTRCCVPLDVTRIGIIRRLRIVLVTPGITILTRDARKILPATVPMASFVFNMANTALITAAFAKNDYSLFARSLNDVVVEPVRARLIRGFHQVKENAIRAGADGVAISGSGPTVFAITDNLRKARAIEQQMVLTFNAQGIPSRSWVTTMDPHGTRVVEPEG